MGRVGTAKIWLVFSDKNIYENEAFPEDQSTQMELEDDTEEGPRLIPSYVEKAIKEAIQMGLYRVCFYMITACI